MTELSTVNWIFFSTVLVNYREMIFTPLYLALEGNKEHIVPLSCTNLSAALSENLHPVIKYPNKGLSHHYTLITASIAEVQVHKTP